MSGCKVEAVPLGILSAIQLLVLLPNRAQANLNSGGDRMQSPDVKKAKILDDYIIHLTFVNGEEKIFDLKPYLKYPVFKPLQDKQELQSFRIVDGTIEWSCGADLSPDTFYLESKPLRNNAIM